MPLCTDKFVDVENKEAQLPDSAIQHDDTGSQPWTLIASPATQRSGAMTAVLNDWIYIYGGEDYSGVRRDFFRYHLTNGDVEVLTNGDYRANGTMTAVGNRLYVFGGYDEHGDDIDKLHGQLRYFDTSTKAWNTIIESNTNGTYPTERHCHIAVLYHDPSDGHNKLYFYGGFTGSANADSHVIELDLDTIGKPTWDTKAAGPVRGSSGAAIVGGSIYIFGGYAKANTGDTYTNEMRVYSIASDSWSLAGTLTATNGARAGMTAVAIDTYLYIYGGNTSTSYLNDLWRFDTSIPVTSSMSPWKRLTDGPAGRCGMGAIAYVDLLYIYGGRYVNASKQSLYTNELWEYDPLEDPLR